MDRNTGFAQYGLRNAGQLVCIDLSFGTAEFISNSANLLAIRSRICAHSGGSDRPRAQNLADFRYNSATPATGARRRLRGQSRDAKTVAKRPRWNDFVRCGQCMLQSLMLIGDNCQLVARQTRRHLSSPGGQSAIVS